ncbi:MAG: hydrogenase formation protein HypD [Porticoccaceae bacterium]|nr:MAG: hydrogenase formation protein HypD [Porticoccaceae bacterium]
MKYLSEFRDAELVAALARRLRATARHPWVLMEVCGGQTHAIVKHALDDLLPPGVELVHGPGCPVCVTPPELIDAAVAIALRDDVVLCSYGDMLRVPGRQGSLQQAAGCGAEVRMVFSPLDALELARQRPDRLVVFFAVGFETTAPASALAAREARRRKLANFRLLVAHYRVPPALEEILRSPDNRVQGFLAPGHVCTVAGFADYHRIARDYRVPIAITGFEPVDILAGVLHCVARLERGEPGVDNPYRRIAREEGNRTARRLVQEVFAVVDQRWRGMGLLPGSGLALKPDYSDLDAAPLAEAPPAAENEPCRAGEVLRGALPPTACPHFGTLCRPEHPLGAPMVSSEGACAAYFHYR